MDQMSGRHSRDSKEEYIDSLVERIRKEDEDDKSEEDLTDNRSKMSSARKKNKRTRKTSQDQSETSSDGEELSSFCSSKRSYRKKKDVQRNRAEKKPIQKASRRTLVPIIVTKDEAERELQLTREDWLKMDLAARGVWHTQPNWNSRGPAVVIFLAGQQAV